MNQESFTTTICVDRSPEEAFEAVTNVRQWWSQEIEGQTDALGAEFTYNYEEVHRAVIRVTELVPGRKVTWLVVDNFFDFTQDRTEWTGTTVTFEISRQADRTEIRFTHHGLVPEYECFDVCSTGWSFYVNDSLHGLITTGEGKPNGRGRPRLPAEERAVARSR